MKHRTSLSSRRQAVTVIEALVSATCLSVVLSGLMATALHLTKTLSVVDGYPAIKLHIADYIAMDLRRAFHYSFTVSDSKLTLPLDLTLPEYYGADGRTLLPLQRTLVSEANTRPRKKHHIYRARHYVHYGDLSSSVPVRYYLFDKILYRKEGSRTAMEIARGIADVSFTPTHLPAGATPTPAEMLAKMELTPEVSVKVTFEPSRYWRNSPPSLSNATFMRNFYFSPF